MKNNRTTIINNPEALARAELEAAQEDLVTARRAYQADHSDANFDVLKQAMDKHEQVERETIRWFKSLFRKSS